MVSFTADGGEWSKEKQERRDAYVKAIESNGLGKMFTKSERRQIVEELRSHGLRRCEFIDFFS